jgi:hypothetical protein
MLTIRTDFEIVRNFFVNCDDSQIDDVKFKSIARRNSFIDSPHDNEKEDANPTGPNDPALFINQHDSYCKEPASVPIDDDDEYFSNTELNSSTIVPRLDKSML